MRLFVAKYPDATEQELKEIAAFKCTTLQLYLSVLDGRACWATLVAVVRILVDCNDDRLFLVCNNGLPMLFEVRLKDCFESSDRNASSISPLLCRYFRPYMTCIMKPQPVMLPAI